jgi:hypothetical protein
MASGIIQTGLLIVTLAVAAWSSRREEPLMTELRQRYDMLLNHLKSTEVVDPRFARLRKRCILTGIHGSRMNRGTIGYNVNKGYEIYICLDKDDINSAMNVLIHELAHVTVDEYDHSPEFWASFKDLKALCKTLGIYTPIEGSIEYCGITIQD